MSTYAQVAERYKELRLREKAGEQLGERDLQRLNASKEWLKSNQPSEAPEPEQHSQMSAALTGLADSASFGFADEGWGAARAGLEKLKGSDQEYGDLYKTHRDEFRKDSDERWDQHPKSYAAGAVAGIVAAPGLGIVKAGNAISKAAPRIFSTSARASAPAGAIGGAVGGAGVAEEMEDVPASAAVGATLGAAAGPVISKVGQKLGIIPKDTNVIEQLIAARIQNHQIKDPKAASTLNGAVETINSVMASFKDDVAVLVDKAINEGKVTKEQARRIRALAQKEGNKTKVFSQRDQDLVNAVFDPEDASHISLLMKSHDHLSQNMSSLHQIGGVAGKALETRNPGALGALVQWSALQKLHRKLIQPGNPVNKLGKQGDQRFYLNVKGDQTQVGAKAAKAPKADGDIFDPDSLDIPHADSNPDIVKPSTPVKPNPAQDLASDEQIRVMGATAAKRGSLTARAEAPVDLPVKDSYELDTMARVVARNKRAKRLNMNQDAPVAPASGWRGNVADQVEQATGVRITQRDIDKATSAALRAYHKADPELGVQLGAQVGSDGPVAPGLMNSVREILMKANARSKVSPEAPQVVPVAPRVPDVDAAGNPIGSQFRYQKGAERIGRMNEAGFTLVDTGVAGPGRWLVKGPRDEVVGTAASSKYAEDLLRERGMLQSGAPGTPVAPPPPSVPPQAPSGPVTPPPQTLAEVVAAEPVKKTKKKGPERMDLRSKATKAGKPVEAEKPPKAAAADDFKPFARTTDAGTFRVTKNEDGDLDVTLDGQWVYTAKSKADAHGYIKDYE